MDSLKRCPERVGLMHERHIGSGAASCQCPSSRIQLVTVRRAALLIAQIRAMEPSPSLLRSILYTATVPSRATRRYPTHYETYRCNA